jgi:activator of HSP90 ATPase
MPKRTHTGPSRPATRREVIAGVSVAVGGLALHKAEAAPSGEISRACESIHQEIDLRAERDRVYSALIDPVQFQKLILVSGAVKSGMVKPTKPAEIDARPGGSFSLFGGHISGRILELVPPERIVQAWRPADWAAGVYSIVRFELFQKGAGTRLVFDHTGFPVGQAEHLATGWKGNYWEPLEAVLAQGR